MASKPGSILASAEATSEAAMASSITRAEALATLLQGASWELFEALGSLGDDRQHAARAIRQWISDALQADEYVTPLAPVLRGAQADAVKLLAQVTRVPAAPPDRPSPARPGTRRIAGERAERLRPDQARALFDRIRATLSENDRRRLTLDWIVEEDE